MDVDVENSDVIYEHGSTNINTLYQHNGLKSLINSNYSDDIEINSDLKNDVVSCGIGLTNSQNLSEYNESS